MAFLIVIDQAMDKKSDTFDCCVVSATQRIKLNFINKMGLFCRTLILNFYFNLEVFLASRTLP